MYRMNMKYLLCNADENIGCCQRSHHVDGGTTDVDVNIRRYFQKSCEQISDLVRTCLAIRYSISEPSLQRATILEEHRKLRNRTHCSKIKIILTYPIRKDCS